MRRLTTAAAILLWSVSTRAAHAESVADWRTHIAAASRRFGVPVRWIARVIAAESAGRTTLGGKPITSRKGAMGLMQLMPATWTEMRAENGLGNDPHDPRDNILAGTAYLRRMYDRFGYPGLFAAYNAGPARYAEALAGRRMLPRQTRAYLAHVTDGAGRAAASAAPPNISQRAALFVPLALPSAPAGAAEDVEPRSDLFAVAPRR